MNNKLYTYQELQDALAKNKNGDESALSHIINKVFEDYTPSTFHNIFSEEYSNIQDRSHLKNYTLFKLNLLIKFFESADSTNFERRLFFLIDRQNYFEKLLFSLENSLPQNIKDLLKYNASDMLTLEPDKLSIILDFIIKNILYRTDDFYFKLIKIKKNYPDIINSKEFYDLYIRAANACLITIKLTNNQKNLLKKYDIINPSKWIEIDLDEKFQIAISADPHYEKHLRNLNDDTIFQMYLLGDSSTTPMSYINIMDLVTEKDESRNSYDDFIIWFWNFAKGKKKNRLVPDQLRLFCSELLRLVSDASTGTSYTKHRFPLNDLEKAWKEFWKANKNAIKRQVKK